jgi:hypothetical protein
MSISSIARSGGVAQSLTITPIARYTAVYAAAQHLGRPVVCSAIRMRHGTVCARGNFGGTVWFNFILPVKEDA